MIYIELPNLSGHPPAPGADIATFERLVIDVFIPQEIVSVKLTQESFISNFMNNEGRQTEPWPDFSGVES